jgi:undecaprenyl-diphosphatase
MQYFSELDLQLFYFLNSFIGRSPFNDEIIRFFAQDLVVILTGIVCVFILLKYKKNRRIGKEFGIVTLCSVLAAFILRRIIHLFYHSVRPLVAYSAPHLFSVNSYSFPSGHTIFMFSLATAVYFFNKPLSYFLYVCGFAIGVSRIIAGVHYPFDILGGIILGILTSVLVHRISKKMLFRY